MAPKPSTRDPYVVLSVARSASVEEVRRAYRQKVLETHPDKLPPTATDRERQLAKDRFYDVQEAFEILSDPSTRKAYDIHGRPLPEQVPKKWEDFESDHAQRIRERKEWAKKSEQRQTDRLKASKEATEDQLQNVNQCTTTVQQSTLVENMLQELYALNPEWEARKKKAQAYKASRLQGQA